MDQPAILAQAGRGHQSGQGVPFARRGGRHRDAPGPARRLMRAGGDEPLANGAGPVLGRDRDLARGPLLAYPAQRGRNDPLAQIEHRHALGQPAELLPGQRLVAVHDRVVQPRGLGRPVPDPDLGPRRGAGRPALGQRDDVRVADLVAAPGLPGRERALPHPPVGGLVVHPERLGGLA
jgi:hypothetical protein